MRVLQPVRNAENELTRLWRLYFSERIQQNEVKLLEYTAHDRYSQKLRYAYGVISNQWKFSLDFILLARTYIYFLLVIN
jgi:hypothetical protein